MERKELLIKLELFEYFYPTLYFLMFFLKRIDDYQRSEAGKKNKMLAMLHSNTKENKKSNK